MSQPIEIAPARLPDDLPAVAALFREYAGGLDVDLCFQDFDAELASLPGAYAPPEGRLLLVRRGDEPVGCGALRPLGDGRCEMKRVFLRPSVRGAGLGERLVRRLCDEARAAGYRELRLDTLPSMTAAIALYERLGFVPIEPYVHNPVPGARFLSLDLRALSPPARTPAADARPDRSP
ncbi:MAG: GNAT family N-acetyltransferase [Burkholderiales bacterium]|jgi:ribosomal protein S18 acetylase RimI-like enzyme